MKIAPFLLCAQISCALVAALDGILSEGVKVSELFDRSQLAAENGYQVGHGQKGLPKRLWRREDQESQVEKRSVETKQEDALTEEAKDKWTSFSEGLNTRERWVEVEKRGGGVFKRDDAQTASVTIGGVNIDEEYLLAFIARDKYKDGECKQRLEEYCKKINENNEILDKMHPLVKSICEKNKAQEKCNKLNAGVTKKCTDLKNTLKQKLQDPSKLTNKDCADYEPECFFLQRACPTDLEDCSKLRDECYEMKRNKVAEKVLLMLLKGSLKKGNDEKNCEDKLSKYCIILSKQSDELMHHCIGPKETCTELIDKVNVDSTALKKELPNVLKQENDQLKVQCLPLLEKCFLYGEDSKEIKDDCEKLEDKCSKLSITYAPPSPLFSPIEPAPGLLEEIGLDELYKKSALAGVFIGRPNPLDEIEFLALVTPYQSNTNNYKTECENKLKNNCKNYIFLPSKIKDLCDEKGNKASNHGDTTCGTLKNGITTKCNSLKIMLEGRYVFQNSNKDKIYTWDELEITYLNEADCKYLESQCFYLEDHCTKDKLEVGCQNLRRACYKRALYDAAYVPLEVALRGEFSSINKHGNSTSDQKKNLLKHCQELGTKSVELFTLCMDPKDTLESLGQDIIEKAYILKPALNEKRDFPTEKDCLELQEKCEHLEADSDMVKEACHTLRTRCQFRHLSEGLKHRLLEEREKTLKTSDECVKMLETKCHHWNRKGENPFDFPCALRNDSCKLMTQRVEDHCNEFEKNKELLDVSSDILLTKECSLWEPPCEQLVPNCKDQKNEIKVFCDKLKEKCKPFRKQMWLEDAVTHELKGSLDKQDNCVKELDKYCTMWQQSSNQTLVSLCNDSSKNTEEANKKVRKDLCDKLVLKVKEQCPVLEKTLKEAKSRLEEEHKKYEKLREKAIKEMEKNSLILSIPLSKNATKDTKLRMVKRDQQVKEVKADIKATAMTIDQANTLILVSEVLEMYLDIKERCEPLILDCGFIKECPGCKEACEVITPKCTSLKSLEVKPPEVITKECKQEAGTGKGSGSGSKPTGEGKTGGESKPSGDASKPSKPEAGGKEEKKCDPVKTVDKWTTTTSTYTTTTTSTKTTTLKVTLTSTRKCKPTKCTTGKGEPTSKGEEEEVMPSGGKRWLPSVGIAIVGVVVAIM